MCSLQALFRSMAPLLDQFPVVVSFVRAAHVSLYHQFCLLLLFLFLCQKINGWYPPLQVCAEEMYELCVIAAERHTL
jgi:hypothetical protein